MLLNEEQRKTIEEFASNFYQPHEIEIVMELPVGSITEALDSPNSDAYKAYYKGFLSSDFELRQSVKESAINGSHPAQMEMLKLSNKLKNTLDG